MIARHLEAVGPVLLEHPVLIEPAPVRLAGRPWGRPRYGVRCRLLEPLPALCTAVDEVVLQQWPDGPPEQLRHPIQHDAKGDWFHAGADAEHPPELFHLSAGEVVPSIGPVRVLEGATALLSVEVVAYEVTGWNGGCDVLLRAVCIVEAGRPTGAAASFSAAIEAASTAA